MSRFILAVIVLMLVVTVAGCNRFPDLSIQVTANLEPGCGITADQEEGSRNPKAHRKRPNPGSRNPRAHRKRPNPDSRNPRAHQQSVKRLPLKKRQIRRNNRIQRRQPNPHRTNQRLNQPPGR